MKKTLLEGQLSIFDIKITEVPTLITKIDKKITESNVLLTESCNTLTENQSSLLEKYKDHPGINRIIQYCGSGVGIELKEGPEYKTIYINKDGKEEFGFNKKSSLLPADKLMYFKNDISLSKIQFEKLRNIRINKDFKRVIHRKGDENLLVELEDKVIYISQNGHELEFVEMKIECCNEEVLFTKEAKKPIKSNENIVDAARVKIGDYVKAYFSKDEIIQGVITREYGMNNDILNISFDNGKKHTAIGRRAVIEVLG